MATFTRALLQGGSRRARQPYPGHALALDFRNGLYRNRGLTTDNLAALPGLTYSQSGACWEIGADGSLIQFGSNEPRLMSGLGLWARSGFTNKADISNSKTAWSGNANTVPASLDNQALAPDGTNTAWMIPAESVGGPRNQRNYPIPADTTTYKWEVFVKALEPGATIRFANNGVHPAPLSTSIFDFADRSFSGASQGVVTPIADDWFRLTQRFTNTGTATTFLLGMEALATTAGKVLFWGATMGAGSMPGPYIPTPTTADASNGPSVLTLPFAQQDEDFVMLVDFNMAAGAPSGTAKRVLALLGHSASLGPNKFKLLIDSSNALMLEVTSSNVSQNVGAFMSGRIASGRGIAAFRYRSRRITLAEKLGAAPINIGAEGTVITPPIGPDLLQLGHSNGGEQLNGIIERVRIIRGSFDNAALANLLTQVAA